jgi:AcrR family transcriptional regulator
MGAIREDDVKVSASQPDGNAQRKHRARGSISAEEIASGAYQLASDESLEALSMPRLAHSLDVGVTSIYWYFRSKDELLETMRERAVSKFYGDLHVDPDLDWDEYLRSYFRQTRRILRQDRLLCDLIVMRPQNVSPVATRIALQSIDSVLTKLRAAGFSDEQASSTYNSLSVYTRGALALERGWQSSSPPDETASAVGLLTVEGMQSPVALVRSTLHAPCDEDFEFGLDNMLRGLRALYDGIASKSTRVPGSSRA